MKEVALQPGLGLEAATFAACVRAVAELGDDEPPRPPQGTDPEGTWTLRRWLAGYGLGLVPVADPASFQWAGPWIATLSDPNDGETRVSVVMYGVPTGLLWDPSGIADAPTWTIERGHIVAALDVATAMPARAPLPSTMGTVVSIHSAPDAGAETQQLQSARALAGLGIEGDRYLDGRGSFPSGVIGSALTLIEAEVCESFDPPLTPEEHRRNVVTRGIDLNALVGAEFTVGAVRCRGRGLCEPCATLDGYASRPLLRPLVHRGGLRADILESGEFSPGDSVAVVDIHIL